MDQLRPFSPQVPWSSDGEWSSGFECLNIYKSQRVEVVRCSNRTWAAKTLYNRWKCWSWIPVSIPRRKGRKKKIRFDRRNYKRCGRIEIMFGRPKDWRRFATRYDRCPIVFLCAIARGSAVLVWLSKLMSL